MVTTIGLITYTIPCARRSLAITILNIFKDVTSFYKKYIIDIMLLPNFDSCSQIIYSICLNNISPKVISVQIFAINIKNITL